MRNMKIKPEVKDMLKNKPKVPFGVDEIEGARNQNQKQSGMHTGLLLLGLIPLGLFMVVGVLLKNVLGDNVFQAILVFVIFIACVLVATVLLLLQDNRRFSAKGDLYVVKAYISNVREARSVRVAVLTYYDYVCNKCVTVQPTLDGKDMYLVRGRQGTFVDVIIAEKKNKVKYVDLKR